MVMAPLLVVNVSCAGAITGTMIANANHNILITEHTFMMSKSVSQSGKAHKR
jgi:hypothetical protein